MISFSRYNKWFGGERGSAKKAHAKMTKLYGKNGDAVFRATVAKRELRAKREGKR